MKFGLFVMGTKSGAYQDIVRQAQFAEELGFDSVVLAERHFDFADCLCPSPFVLGATIAAKTNRIRIGTAARILPLDHPLRIAEDAATLDVLSDGRFDFGAARASLDEDSHRVFRSPKEESKKRFEECLEIIIRSWTQERFSYDGLYYKIPEVGVRPFPIQKPHPPISIVSVSPETLSFAVENGYSAILGGIRSHPELCQAADYYWKTLDHSGRNRKNVQLTINRFIYVSENGDRATNEIEEPFMEFIKNRAPDLKGALSQKYGGEQNFRFNRFAEEFCIFGSPETVTSRLEDLYRMVEFDSLLCSLNLITHDHKLCIKSMDLFGKEVIPALRLLRKQPSLDAGAASSA